MWGGVQIGETPSVLGSSSFGTTSKTISDLEVGKVYLLVVTTYFTTGSVNVTLNQDYLWRLMHIQQSVGSAYFRGYIYAFRASNTSITVNFGGSTIYGGAYILDYNTFV